jgi:hypothetical protein
MSREIESFEAALSEYKSTKEMYSKIKIQIYSVYKFKKDFAEFDRYFYTEDQAIKYTDENKYTFILKEFMDATGERNMGKV